MLRNKEHEMPDEHNDHHCSDRIAKILRHFEQNSFKIDAPEDINDRPVYGTTLYLATCNNIQMHCGTFTAYVFQDIIHKGYIIALAFGDIFHTKTFYTRVHSSCVTSETLQGCDCDCREQLEGSLILLQKRVWASFFIQCKKVEVWVILPRREIGCYYRQAMTKYLLLKHTNY